MPGESKIEWTEATWNPVTGCTKVSAGCDHCYAETFAERFRGVPGHPYEQGFDLKLWPERLDIPLRWTKPRRIFVNSMSDLFHADVPDEFILRVFAVMANSRQHTYQILTKRPQRMARFVGRMRWRFGTRGGGPWRMAETGDAMLTVRPVLDQDGDPEPPPNVWLGVSVEDQAAAYRIDWLVKTPAAVRFLSCEPLIGPLDLLPWLWRCPRCEASGDRTSPERSPFGNVWCFECNHRGDGRPYAMERADRLHWVIVGGESGHGARAMELVWAHQIAHDCRQAGVPVFVKQLGSVLAKQAGGPPKGGDPVFWPPALRVRQFPAV
jgi:protein gp37